MAIKRRSTTNETVIHSGHSVQFTSSGFSEHAVNYGLLPSMGTISECFDYIEVFHNHQRRHSTLDMLSPVELELELQFKQLTVV